MTPERWLPVPGYEGIYDVSDLGRVRSWAPWRGEPVPRILNPSVSSNERLNVTLCKSGTREVHYVHALAMLVFIGPCPDGLERRHLDGNHLNNRAENLAYGTSSENKQDSLRLGVFSNGNTHKTQCKRRHPFDTENTYVSRGKRYCRTCRRDADLARRPAHRAAGRDYMRAKRAAARAA